MPRPPRPIYFPSASDFRSWLEENHASADGLVVGFMKRRSGKPSLIWPESVDKALCLGWIDGVRRGLDRDRRKGTKSGKPIGRPRPSQVMLHAARDLVVALDAHR